MVVSGNVAVLGDRERLEERLLPPPRLPVLHHTVEYTPLIKSQLASRN